MREFFSDKKNIVICVLIFILVIAVGTCGILGVLLSKKNNTISKKNAIITNASAQAEADSSILEESQKKIDEQQAQIDNVTGQNASLLQENNALREQLAAKKMAASNAAKEAARQAAIAASAKRTQEIIAALSLPPTQQAAALPNVCYLTFDDGPSDVTLSILDTLAIYNIKATFFVKGNSKMEYLPNIVAGGHAIGLHTNCHEYGQIYTSVESYLTDLQGISQKVESLTGVKSSIMRFPGGSSNKISAKYCGGIMTQLTQLLPQMGYSYFDWNVSSGDADGNGIAATKLVSNVIAGARGKQSICVLMHDTNAKRTTAQALPAIIESLVSIGFRFEAITPQTYGYHHSVNN